MTTREMPVRLYGGAPANGDRCRTLTRRRALAYGLALAVSVMGTRQSHATKLDKLAVKIAAGNAPVSLAEFVRQTGLQVLFDFEAVRNFTTREVSGDLNAEEALLRMFEGSGLTFEFINERTIAVRPRLVTATPVSRPVSEGT